MIPIWAVWAEIANRINKVHAEGAAFSVDAFSQAFPNIWAACLKKLGVKDNSAFHYIASGDNGSAYTFGSDEVVKFTTDDAEVLAMAKVGRGSKYIVDVHDVFWMPYPGRGNVGVVRQEKVSPGAKDWKNFGELATFYYSEILGKTPFNPIAVDQFRDWAVRQFSKRAQGSMVQAAEKTKVPKLSKRQPSEKERDNIFFRENDPDQPWGDWVDKSAKMPTEEMFEWFRGLCEELQSKGISFYDLNGGNMMKRNGQHVVIDLGLSDVKSPPAVDDSLVKQFEGVAGAIEAMYVEAALNKRLAGVAKQYGPEIALMVGDVLLGNHNSFYLQENGISQIREDANYVDKSVDDLLKGYLDTGRWYDEHPIAQDSNVDALAPWVAKNINQQKKAGNIDYMDLQLLSKRIQDVADWAKTERVDLMQFNLEQAVTRARRWAAQKKREDMAKKAPPSEIVFEEGPWRFFALTSKEALEHEGDCQRHCVGRYWDDVKSGRTKIFSVRDAAGVSKATIEVNSYDVVKQVRGPANRDVTDESLLAAIEKFFASNGFGKQAEIDRHLYGTNRSPK